MIKVGQVGGNRKPQTFRNCEWCKERFGPLPRLKIRFCSTRCVGESRHGTTSAKKGRKYPHLMRAEKRICLVCQKEFRAIKDQNGKFGSDIIRLQKYCSKKCWNVRSILNTTNCEKCQKSFIPLGTPLPKYCSRKCAWGDMRGEKAGQWKGARVGYSGLHKWVQLKLGKPMKCEFCGFESDSPSKIHWANKSQLYRRKVDDWLRLCAKCHKQYDSKKPSTIIK